MSTIRQCSQDTCRGELRIVLRGKAALASEEIFDFIPTQLRLPSYLSLPVFGGRSSSLGGDHNRRVQ